MRCAVAVWVAQALGAGLLGPPGAGLGLDADDGGAEHEGGLGAGEGLYDVEPAGA